uniref:Protein SPT2 homolog n=1 Tax=Globodera rostochiensis TaxID=31243 RepID=A0A914I434_GLORO
MDFNFQDLVHQAERNAKRQERKVHEAEREMKARQQQHMERLAYEKAREKLALKRRAPPPAPQRQQSPPAPALPLPPLAAKRDRTTRLDTVAGGNKGPPQLPRKPLDGGEPTFVIPKKSSAPHSSAGAGAAAVVSVAASSSVATAARKTQAPKQNCIQTPLQKNGAQIGQVQRQQHQPKASSGSATENKRPRISMPAPTQQKHDPFTALMAKANQNDASAVERLIEQTAVAEAEACSAPTRQQQQRRSKPTPNKAPEAEVGVSAGRELTYAAAVRERIAKQQQQAVVEKKRRLTATGYRILPPEDSEPKLASSKSVQPPPAQQQQQQKITKTVPTNGQTLATPKVAKIVERDKPSKTQQGGNVQQMSRQTNGTSALLHSASKQQKVPNIAAGGGKSVNNKTAQQQQSQSQPAQQQQQQPQKRYLPGDVRYQGTPSAAKTAPQQPAIKKAVVPTNVGGGPPPPSPQVDSKRKANTASAESSLTTATKSVGVAPKARKMETTPKGAELGKFRAREMELEAALKREREKVARMMAMAKEAQNRKPKPQQQQAMISENTGSLARIKREAQLRREMALAHQRDRQPSSSSRKFANYSETDEDDENDDYRGRREDEEDDEYDSDMADFIDDSMVDDMQREDFEETLKIINPRYNKEQWLLRERMIDERRMDARFRPAGGEAGQQSTRLMNSGKMPVI